MIKIPNHVAVIPDGNRRWAKDRGLSPWLGHKNGADNFKNVLRAAFELKIPCFSFWASSKENLRKRSPLETKFLLNLFKNGSANLVKDKHVHQNEVKVNIFGDWRNQFSDNVKEPMEELIRRTRNYNKLQLNLFVAYSGIDEMIKAIRKISQKKIRITPEIIKEYLFTKDLPPVDYLIRTGGEPHNSSGFMMWDTTDSQLYFSEKNWPDFAGNDFKEAIEEYSKRGRRFGA